MTKKLYIFSGLGADERVFQKLDFSGYDPIFIQWIAPMVNETIEHYAVRLLEQIKSPKPTLIGLSFGGMVAVEVARQIDTEKVILISSAKIKDEIPFYARMAGRIGLHRLLPIQLFKSANFITNWFFGAESDYDKQLLNQILHDTDPIFLKWAIDQLLRWDNQWQPKNLVHIHGTQDRLLPHRFVKCDETIPDGGHFMVVNKFYEVNLLLRKLL